MTASKPVLTFRAKAALSLLSLALSLAALEGAARVLRRSAFPYLNLFEADARYGVRLHPRDQTRLRSRLGRVTDITTNDLGFRGKSWPPPVSQSVSGILLLGDSQMFGYGVNEEDATAAKIEQRLGMPVLNASVPSWGPSESVLALSDLAPKYRPRFVLFVANAANDWFEWAVPNTRRTTARDGWASGDLALRSGLSFPGREWLLSRSHLVFAARELWEHRAARSIGTGEGSLPAETATQLVHDRERLRKTSAPHRSPVTSSLLQAREICRTLGCTVVAVALPLDLQVDPREWRKYGSSPIDLSSTESLLEDFIADADEEGIPAINLLAPLREASPGAFLPDDYHLSPKGHGAVAASISGQLRQLSRFAEVVR